MKLERSWSLSSKAEILKFERKIRFDLPDDYKAFIETQNGGFLYEATLFPLNLGLTPLIEEGIEIFYGLDAPPNFSLSHSFDRYHITQRRMPDYLIAIGRDQGGNQICMLLNNQMFGYIVFWDHDKEIEFEEPEEAENPLSNCRLIAKSFQSFLTLLDKEDRRS